MAPPGSCCCNLTAARTVGLRDQACNVPIIFITAYDDAEIRAQAMKEGAVEFLAKPLDHQQLLKMLRSTLDG